MRFAAVYAALAVGLRAGPAAGLFRASALICAALLCSPQLALAFSQQAELAGTFASALSADGNTAILGGFGDAAEIFTRSGTMWTLQAVLVGSGAVRTAQQGASVALSADGNTAILGWAGDNSGAGAAWVFTRRVAVWSQQGSKLVGTGAVGAAGQGSSVALSGDGNTAILGGPGDNSGAGAAWVFTRSGTVWTQQGNKLVGTGAVGAAGQGGSVGLSGDGNTAILGGPNDGPTSCDEFGVICGPTGAAWVFTRSGTVWSQQGSNLVGTPAAASEQGFSVALSGDGNTAILGGPYDTQDPFSLPRLGAAWVFTRSGTVWTQQVKLVGACGVNPIGTLGGTSVALSTNGNTAISGAPTACFDFDTGIITGATWVFTRSGLRHFPTETTLKIAAGHEAVQAIQMVPKTEHFVEIDNGNPGLRWVRIEVNGQYARSLSLTSGETVHVDLASFMTLDRNTLTFTGEGKLGSFANLDISDSVPAKPKLPKDREAGTWSRLKFEVPGGE